ncbi:hypothetical protein CLV24_1179 [Pontibacter ummariensis]|uniref:Uncharacterized protein n=1 Tax=Pontibacter ummariensis TaxID=1610492 RepID=A0A239IDF3_9BACT|nr:hypothetical protein [Pontibacter ummariensis]PRY09805.1 hypothetical protein CLV24_1179 [Pontibacter ummariensis]SNS91796.1 hypothetical protein SAMN06296052_1179 [Pontibacter ummariensis]
MKRFKVNAMAIVAVVVAAGTVAFKAPVAQEWVFTGSDINQVKTASFYSLSAVPEGCEDSASLPCSILSEATSQSQLQSYLNSRTTEQIMDEAVGQRD